MAGRRVTDDAALEVAKMVFAGTVNLDMLCALRRHGVQAVGRIALDVGDQVHHVAVALDEEASGDTHAGHAAGRRRLVGTGLLQHGHTAHIVAAQVQQHQVLGAFLGVGDEFLLERTVLLGRGAARASASEGPDGNLAVSQPDQDFG